MVKTRGMQKNLKEKNQNVNETDKKKGRNAIKKRKNSDSIERNLSIDELLKMCRPLKVLLRRCDHVDENVHVESHEKNGELLEIYLLK